MGRFNKASAAAIATAVTSIVGAVWVEASMEVIAAIQTLLVTAMVWLVPNKE